MAQNGTQEFKVADFVDGPTELWKRKLKTLFHCIDADNNGFLNRKDLPILASKFQKYGSMTDEQTKEFTEKLSLWWDALFSIDVSYSFEVRIVVLSLQAGVFIDRELPFRSVPRMCAIITQMYKALLFKGI